MNNDDLLERFQKLRTDPLFFLSAVRTLDEANKENPIRPFPVHLPYIQLFVKVWQKEKMLLVPKSRRMKMSWVTIALYTWDTMLNFGRHNAILSKKEDDADFLIRGRVKFILENLDTSIFPKELIPRYKYTYNLIEFPDIHSKIQGFPQGSSQLRQYTLSGIFADELAFWEKTEETFSAARPCLVGGGRFTGVSSPSPGFFKSMVLDTVEDGQQHITEKKFAMINRKKPMHGVEIWRNPVNKFLVFQLHYTADVEKRSLEWKKDAMAGMPLKHFNLEFELMWDVYSGCPVYPDFNKEVHISKEKLYPSIGLPLLIGIDFGLTPAAIICQLIDKTLFVYKEFTAENMGAERFSDIVISQIQVIYPSWRDIKNDYLFFADPSGAFRKDTDERSCFEILGAKVGNIIPGEITWEKRRKSVEDLLVKLSNKMGCLVINNGECPILQAGFEGGYRYPESALELEMNKIRPIKDKHSHIHDALQMITTKVFEINGRPKIVIPSQGYSWQNNRNRSSIPRWPT